MTAEKFLKKKYTEFYNKYPESFKNKISLKNYVEIHVTGRVNGIEKNNAELMQEYAVEFAKYHVEQALKAALEEAPTGSSTDIPSYEDMEDAILNAYPLENII